MKNISLTDEDFRNLEKNHPEIRKKIEYIAVIVQNEQYGNNIGFRLSNKCTIDFVMRSLGWFKNYDFVNDVLIWLMSDHHKNLQIFESYFGFYFSMQPNETTMRAIKLMKINQIH